MHSWLGAITGMFGGLLLALNFEYSKFGYLFFMASAISWIIQGIAYQDKALIILNIFFIMINIIGIYRWF